MTEDEYETLARPELASLVRALDALEVPGFEAELANDILTLEFDDGTRYIVNSHRAARQIWMAAERTAWHFDWAPARGRWIATKSGDELWEALAAALSRRLGQPVTLQHP